MLLHKKDKKPNHVSVHEKIDILSSVQAFLFYSEEKVSLFSGKKKPHGNERTCSQASFTDIKLITHDLSKASTEFDVKYAPILAVANLV